MFSCSVFISSNHDPSSTAPAKTTIASQDQSEETKTYKIHRNLHSHNTIITITILITIVVPAIFPKKKSFSSLSEKYLSIYYRLKWDLYKIIRLLYFPHHIVFVFFYLFCFRQSGEAICNGVLVFGVQFGVLRFILFSISIIFNCSIS